MADRVGFEVERHATRPPPPFDCCDLLSLAQAGVAPFTKTWRGPGVYEGEDDITFDFKWSPGRVSFSRVTHKEQQ